MFKKIWLLALGLLISLIIIANSDRQKSTMSERILEDPPKNVAEHPIVIGYSNWPGWWPWAIAESEGLFAKNGLNNLELRWYDNYTQSIDDLKAGNINGNCQTLNDTLSTVDDALKGEVVVLINDNSAGNDKIIAAQGINEVKDLKGKKVAVEAGVVDDFLLTLALEQENLSRSEIKVFNLETGAAAEAFVTKQVDAVGAFPPFWLTALQRSGSQELISSAAFPGAIPDLLVVTEELIEKYPEQVQSLVNTWFDVLRFMASDLDRAEEIMANRAGITRSELQLLKAGTKIFTFNENLAAFVEGNNMTSIHYAAEKIAENLQFDLKLISKKPNIRRMFNSNFLSGVKKSNS
ncbi:MAG: ABC transporter substrate-binding protein [Pleurocapsa minor HA4230-MV1]|jgi:NitT/TauT family transport system substrate-binding protein|nr:ABC transporter substrate-binding protein [Pleurocapsa minor HA4230-MV1]